MSKITATTCVLNNLLMKQLSAPKHVHSVSPPALSDSIGSKRLYIPLPHFFFYHNYTFSVKLTHMFKKKQRNYCNFATYPSWLHLLCYWSILSGVKMKHLPFLCLSEASKYPTMTAEREMGKKCAGCRLVVKRAVVEVEGVESGWGGGSKERRAYMPEDEPK